MPHLPNDQPRRNPALRHHKASGRAFVELNGHRRYVGRWDTPEAHQAYHALLMEWLAHGRCLPPPPEELTVTELIALYLRYAEKYYVKNGKPTSEADEVKRAMRPLRKLYGCLPARAFSPKKLTHVRETWAGGGLARSTCNSRTRIVVRMFKWAVTEELVSAEVWHALQALDGLKAGRSKARETQPVRPVPPDDVEKVLNHLPQPLAAMVRLQVLTGARPGELVGLRPMDIDASGDVWRAQLTDHKTKHLEKQRVLYFGPQAQSILRPLLVSRRTEEPLFSPREAVKERRAEGATCRRRPGQPPSARATDRVVRAAYSTDSYRRAVKTACVKAGVPVFSPHRLRHTSATMVRKQFGLDAAQVWCGHTNAKVSEVYAELDQDKVVALAKAIGCPFCLTDSAIRARSSRTQNVFSARPSSSAARCSSGNLSNPIRARNS